MKLPDHVFIVPNKGIDSMGAGFVLTTTTPFYLGRVIKLAPSPFSIAEYKNKFNPLVFSEVDGYSILIAFAGNLVSGYHVQVSGANWEKELQSVFDKMAAFFMDEKIKNNPGYYKRYRL